MKNVTSSLSAERQSNFMRSLVVFSKDHRAAHWSGTFGTFLETVFPHDPRGITRSSHQYMWDMIRAEGCADDSGQQLHCRLFDDELYGIDETLDRLVDYFKAASARSPVPSAFATSSGSTASSSIASFAQAGPSSIAMQQCHSG